MHKCEHGEKVLWSLPGVTCTCVSCEPHVQVLVKAVASMSFEQGYMSLEVKKIDSSLYEDFKNHYFGDEILHRFDLCSMLKKKQPNGYYYCESSIVFENPRFNTSTG
ncbi:hypothetical protein EK904_009902 [Melospiza melodia maxima]|nr:hypothetical protein EK904_009902 [Melospiza melodia maxima]